MKPEEDKTNPEFAEKLAGAADQAAHLRDVLLESAKVAGMAGDRWKQAEALMSLAKSADTLRENISRVSASLGDGGTVVPLTVITPEPISAPRTRKSKTDYPKYAVRGDTLVKTGLGRDGRAEYEHVVPIFDFDRIIERVASLATTKRQFSVPDVQDHVTCPSYQTYIVLAILRDRGLIVSERRGKYSFRSPKNFAAEAPMLWNELSGGQI